MTEAKRMSAEYIRAQVTELRQLAERYKSHSPIAEVAMNLAAGTIAALESDLEAARATALELAISTLERREPHIGAWSDPLTVIRALKGKP